jgi:hypothetical protein
MIDKILYDGIYFLQGDEKVDGYYTSNEKGEVVKHKYKEPTIWERLKYYLKYWYPMDTETKTTDYFCFDKTYPTEVFSKTNRGDAISTAREVKLHLYSAPKYSYQISGNKLIVDKGLYIAEIEIMNDGKKLNVHQRKKNSNKFEFLDTYTFLDWRSL